MYSFEWCQNKHVNLPLAMQWLCSEQVHSRSVFTEKFTEFTEVRKD